MLGILNAALVGCNRTEKLMRSLMTKSVNAVDAFYQHSSYDAASQLQEGLERAYSTVRVPFLVASTHGSRNAGTSIR